MKYKTTKSVTQEFEIPLPCYLKYGEQYTKILNEESAIFVKNYEFNKCVKKEHVCQNDPFGNEGWVFITEDEFNEVFTKVMDELKQYEPVTA